MGVEGAAVTSAEAAQYRAVGWWTDTTLSERVANNAASTPDKPAYVDFSLDSPDQMLTWSEFDHAATNLAHRLRAFGVAPGDGVAVWHKDTSAIHVLLVAIERCGAIAVGLGARAGVREVTAILRTARPTLVVSDVERLAPAQQAAGDADPNLRVVALGDGSADLCHRYDCPTGRRKRPVTRGTRRRLPDQLHVGHHRAAQMRCAHPEPVALLPPEGRRQRRTHRGRRVPSGDPHAVRLRDLDLPHHADPPGRDDGPNRAVRSPPRRARRSRGTGPRCCAASARSWR